MSTHVAVPRNKYAALLRKAELIQELATALTLTLPLLETMGDDLDVLHRVRNALACVELEKGLYANSKELSRKKG
jgi:hypothetical protein